MNGQSDEFDELLNLEEQYQQEGRTAGILYVDGCVGKNNAYGIMLTPQRVGKQAGKAARLERRQTARCRKGNWWDVLTTMFDLNLYHCVLHSRGEYRVLT